jgi:hypothetical protein
MGGWLVEAIEETESETDCFYMRRGVEEKTARTDGTNRAQKFDTQ